MPNREIKESCRSSPTLEQLSDFAERLFWRLITVADDFGRFPADPRYIRSECFPLRDNLKTSKVEQAYQELITCQLVTAYADRCRTYGYFTTWTKHQRTRALHSKYPAPSPDNICRQMQSDSADLRSTKDPDLRSTICERESAREARPSPSPNGNGYTQGFETLWKSAPQEMRVGKMACFVVWKAKHLEPRAEQIAVALKAWDNEDRWRKDAHGNRCYPNLRTWLNQGRYDDAS